MLIRELLKLPLSPTWHADAETCLDELIGDRYGVNARKSVALRCPRFSSDKGVTFAAILHEESPSSGGYGGTSLVIFPSEGSALVALVVGTQGLSPDEAILTRPGHARVTKSLASWLREMPEFTTAWAKSDPTRIDLPIPAEVAARYEGHAAAIKKYGDLVYLVFDATNASGDLLQKAFVAMCDLYMRERGISPRQAHRAEADAIREEFEQRVMRNLSRAELEELIRKRRFAIVQGPPGTGKTRLARELISNEFAGQGMVIQFHPSVGSEQFIGGLSPTERHNQFGFEAAPGHLMVAAKEAAENGGRPYLLVIDEINRADLAKTLGEAIYLLEPDEPDRHVTLPFGFGEPWGRELRLPPNLHILGTMNSADRSIAILDLAIRRRFAFVSQWPDASALDSCAQLARNAFLELRRIFMAEATDDQLELLPGHAYFLASSEDDAKRRLTFELVPLLKDYLKQGLIPGFAEHVEGYLQSLEAMTAR